MPRSVNSYEKKVTDPALATTRPPRRGKKAMAPCRGVQNEVPHDLTAIIDSVDRTGRGAGDVVDRDERDAVRSQKGTATPYSISEVPHDLTAIGDPIGRGVLGTGKIDNGECDAVHGQEAVV